MRKIFGLMLFIVMFVPVMSVAQDTPENKPDPHVAAPTGTQPPQSVAGYPSGSSAAMQDQAHKDLADVLFTYLALAIVFESALHPIFNWRFFLTRLDGKGLKTPLTVLIAFFVFWRYNLDIIRDILNAQHYEGGGNNFTSGGHFITALLIAGGSSGILQVFTKLGIRPTEAERDQKVQKAKAEDASTGVKKA